jgi:hypothetical protein
MLTSKLIWQPSDLPHSESSAITPLSVGICRPLQGSETEELSIPGCPAASLGGEGGNNGLDDSGPPASAVFGSMEGSGEELEVPERPLGFISGDGVKGKGKVRDCTQSPDGACLRFRNQNAFKTGARPGALFGGHPGCLTMVRKVFMARYHSFATLARCGKAASSRHRGPASGTSGDPQWVPIWLD